MIVSLIDHSVYLLRKRTLDKESLKNYDEIVPSGTVASCVYKSLDTELCDTYHIAKGDPTGVIGIPDKPGRYLVEEEVGRAISVVGSRIPAGVRLYYPGKLSGVRVDRWHFQFLVPVVGAPI